MEREEILMLAGEIGINEETANGYPSDNTIVAFANAIAAHERTACIQACDAEDYMEPSGYQSDYEVAYARWEARKECADAIRSRGNK